jgi:hypothetical protein
MLMRSALFWDITQHCLVIFTDVSGQRIVPIFKGEEVLLDFLTHEDGTHTFSRNICKLLTHNAAQYPRRAQILLPTSCTIFYIYYQVRTQNFSLGGPDPEAIYNSCFVLKIMLQKSCCKCNTTLCAAALIYIGI